MVNEYTYPQFTVIGVPIWILYMYYHVYVLTLIEVNRDTGIYRGVNK